MTGEIIERVARAICRKAHLLRWPDGPWREGELDAKVEEYWPLWVPAAVAAIEALREPTAAMLLAGWGRFAQDEGLATWHDMIDEALGKERKFGDPDDDVLDTL